LSSSRFAPGKGNSALSRDRREGLCLDAREIRKSGVDLDRNPHIRLVSYIYNMPTVLAAADLVICRAGAIT
jgi:UDP-N-acetylglucosamine--N-acetylmuramyl-(pentapeptide) pyrophosphoryl-undecaprenol N-acetylglucosamine transferase